MTAPAAAQAAVVSPASTTGTQGGNSDAPTEKPAAAVATEAPKKSLRERAKELFTGKKPDAAEKPASDVEVQTEKAPVDGEDSPEEAKTIPMAAFKERLHRESEKTKSARAEAHDARLEVKRTGAALDAALKEIARLSRAAQDGTKLDPRDETIRAHELLNTLRAQGEEIQNAHAGELSAAEEAAEQSEVRSQIGEEVAAALKSAPLVSRAELIEACKRPDNLGRSISEVAAEIEASKFDLVRKRIASEKPAAPSTARPSGGGNGAHQFPNNARGMAARLAVLRQTGR